MNKKEKNKTKEPTVQAKPFQWKYHLSDWFHFDSAQSIWTAGVWNWKLALAQIGGHFPWSKKQITKLTISIPLEEKVFLVNVLFYDDAFYPIQMNAGEISSPHSKLHFNQWNRYFQKNICLPLVLRYYQPLVSLLLYLLFLFILLWNRSQIINNNLFICSYCNIL